ncbi:hypothetical protein BW723_09955 [Polaribacter reichenbachii]|uniref:DUF4159 domain-containing protein n=1 Tax=Polaribacter reichenbachii TaxID=996801 RepID=A0A1B8U3N7_9FLAO|nr:DUF4159 domain-containing protein [Polaribacter reichenbachii]APZ46595.1 hypothetical protein BW723_09955 [Polaribacter reichenbachii]AUC17241.1 hypothetical protein BTO17_00405 [Polaribacter reichenbachii]OBY66419.1 hypothetical protein LPB301_06920 [Polaribacter reichenbachii]
MKQFITLLFLSIFFQLNAQDVAILKYNGGGDWYANPTAIPNLVEFTNHNIKTNISKNPQTVAVNSEDIYNYPLLFLTGHGNVYFSDNEATNLKNYLISGGFLHISDNYGLDKFIRRELKKVFPSLELKEIPSNHPIYNQTFKFPNGIPKIHEHDKKNAQGFGLFYEGRLIVFYDYETDLSDGWEDQIIHNNPKEVREKALKMGANIIEYAFTN